ncbi:MAG: nucleotidyltransferase family protein [Bacteroidota bacterium]
MDKERKNKILNELKREIIAILGFKFVKLILFGSYARGEEKEFSDIDLLLLVREELTKEEKEKIYTTVSNISLENDVVISLIDYPDAIFNSFNTPFLQSVKGEGIEI